MEERTQAAAKAETEGGTLQKQTAEAEAINSEKETIEKTNYGYALDAPEGREDSLK